MARADWVANVFKTSTTSGGNSPGALRLKDRLADDLRPRGAGARRGARGIRTG